MAEEGTRAQLICSINKGHTPIHIVWSKDGKTLLSPNQAAQQSSITVNLLAPSYFYHTLPPLKHASIAGSPSSVSSSSSSSSISTPQHYTIQTQEDYSSTIQFRSVQITDRGLYTCTASNTAGVVNRTLEFVVHCKLIAFTVDSIVFVSFFFFFVVSI